MLKLSKLCAASEQLGEIGAEPHDGALLHRFDMAAEQIRLEARVETLHQLAHALVAVGEIVPFGGGEELERGGARRRLSLPEVQVGDGGRPRRHVGGQQPRLAHEGIDEGALAGLDLPDDGDAEHLLIEATDRLADECLPGRLDETGERAPAVDDLLLRCRQRSADAIRLESAQGTRTAGPRPSARAPFM